MENTETKKPNRFNVRVYFILMDIKKEHVLVSDEIIRGDAYTKFPGGGLEFGEGTHECVKREAFEELGQEVSDIIHFYTSDFFIQSAFNKSDQVISIYYTACLVNKPLFRTSEKKFDFFQSVNNEESFRWVKVLNLSQEEFTFPADKEVARKISAQYNP